MRLVTFERGGAARLGVWRKDGTAVIPLETLLIDYPDMTALIANLTDEERAFVLDILRECEETAAREAAVLYRQGWKDSLWLLKTTGLLA